MITTPEQTRLTHEIHSTPAALSGLEPLQPGVMVGLEHIGVNFADRNPIYGDSFAIVTGAGEGRDLAGRAARYRHNPNAYVTRIIDVSAFPVTVETEKGSERTNFVAVASRPDGKGWRESVVNPLLPGSAYEVQDAEGEPVARYMVTEEGQFAITRLPGNVDEVDVRLVGEHEYAGEYAVRPVRAAASPAKTVMQQTVQHEWPKPKADPDYDLVLDPGVLAAEKDAVTGETRTSVLQRPMMIPYGRPGRNEERIADKLARRQRSQEDEVRYRVSAPPAPQYRYMTR